MAQLSNRLAKILSFCRLGEEVWDVCCDHGYLGEGALASGNFPRVHFVDQVPQIIDGVRCRLQVNPNAIFRAMDAAQMTESMSGSVVVAGIGAHRLRKILASWQESGALARVQRLILGPQKDVEILESWICDQMLSRQWILSDRCEVIERERSRRLIVLDRVSESE